MTKSSWLMNKVASKLKSVVPANDLKSLNRLKWRRAQIILFLAYTYFFRLKDNKDYNFKKTFSNK